MGYSKVFLFFVFVVVLSNPTFSYEKISLFNKQFFVKEMKTLIVSQDQVLKNAQININVKNSAIFDFFPDDASYFNIIVPKHKNLIGKRMIPVEFLDKKGDFIQKVSVVVQSVAQVRVMVAASQIEPGDVLEKESLIFKTVPYSSKTINYSTSVESVLGKEAKKVIPKGTILTSKWLMDVPEVRKGDVVYTVVSGEGYELEMKGQALDSGLKGDFIRVKTGFSKKIVKGEINDGKRVFVSSY